jgi:hypothetical protein
LNNKILLNNKRAVGIFLVALFICVIPNIVFSQKTLHQFFKLSCPEKRWVITHPFIAHGTYKISIEALEITKNKVQDNLLDGDINGGQLDAFRHAYWMARISQKYGWRRAFTLGKTHEKGNYLDFKKNRLEEGTLPDEPSSQMDFLNNDVGIQLGKENPVATSDELSKKIEELILAGKLFVIKKNKTGQFLNCQGEIISIEEIKGKWNNSKCIISSNIYKK